MPTGPSPQVLLRRLISEIAPVMQEAYTFSEIAALFYEVGVIDAPESPYKDGYPGSKRDYVTERLHNAPDLSDFLRTTVPRVVFDADIEGTSSTSALEWVLQGLGYFKDPGEEAVQHGIASYTAPDRLPVMSASPTRAVSGIGIPDLPSSIEDLITELNDCLGRGHKNAAALLLRKIIHQAVFIALQKRGKGDLLTTDSGGDVELGAALKRCQQELRLSNQVVNRVTAAKWIGDSANHSYRVKINEDDLERAVTAVRLFLQEVL